MEEELQVVPLKDFVYFALQYANGLNHISKGQIDQLIAYTKAMRCITVAESDEALHKALHKYLWMCFDGR